MTDDATRCPKCNSETLSGAHFCMGCGAALDTSPQIEIDLDLEDLRVSAPTPVPAEAAPKGRGQWREPGLSVPSLKSHKPNTPAPKAKHEASETSAPDFTIDEIDDGFEAIQSIAPGTSGVPTSRDASDVGSLADMEALLSELISAHLLPVRDLIVDLESGKRKSEWLEVSRPAARAVQAAAEQLSNTSLRVALSELSATLDDATLTATRSLSVKTSEKLRKAYAKVAELLPELERLARAREQKNPIVSAILEHTQGLDRTQRERLYAAGITDLHTFEHARPEELAQVSGITVELAERVQRGAQEQAAANATNNNPPSFAKPTPGGTASVFDSSAGSFSEEESGKRMADLSRDEVLRRVRLKQSLKRAGLSGIDLSSANLEGVDFSRADLDGANLEGAKLRGALFKNASMRGINLKGADLEQCNLENADLTDANLETARLGSANLDRAVLERAKLDQATLADASLIRAELTSASLVRALMQEAELSHADLSDAVLKHTNLASAHLTSANLCSANLEHAVLDEAVLDDADLTSANLFATSLRMASLARCNLESVNLSEARLHNASFENARLLGLRAEWIDTSTAGDGSERLTGEALLDFLRGKKLESSEQPSTRYFGKGDILRDATLEFGRGSKIHIDSRFENCTISLGEGAELTVGDPGVLRNCQITGSGDITIHGAFFERQSPGIAGARSLVVSSKGAMVGAVEQAPESTMFAFQPGCRLRVKILRPRLPQAAE